MFREGSYMKEEKVEKPIPLSSTKRKFAKTETRLKPDEEYSIFSVTASKIHYDNGKKKQPNRRAKTALTHFRPKVEFFNGTFSNFGKDAPKIGIGSSRKDDPPPPDYPGPGTYDIPPVKVSPLTSTIPKATKFYDPPVATVNVALADTRVFPEIRRKNIGPRSNKPFFDLIESPGPNFMPPSTLSTSGHKICEKKEEEKTSNMFTPGPGTYDPNRVDLERAPAYYLSGPSSRDDWLKDKMKRPGPGKYSPSVKFLTQSQPIPSYLFGDKSRKKKRSNPPIAIDRCLIRLEPGMDRDKCIAYLEKHSDIKDFIAELMDELIYFKPPDPVAYLREKFGEQKEKRDAKMQRVKTLQDINFAELLK